MHGGCVVLTDITVGLLYQVLHHIFVSSEACLVEKGPVLIIPHICT